MATITKARVKERALELLGIKPVFQGAQSQDINRIEEAYDEVYESLQEVGMAIWPSGGPVPNMIVPHLVALMAFTAVDDYGISGERYQRIAVKAKGAKTAIKALSNPPYESLAEPDDF